MAVLTLKEFLKERASEGEGGVGCTHRVWQRDTGLGKEEGRCLWRFMQNKQCQTVRGEEIT